MWSSLLNGLCTYVCTYVHTLRTYISTNASATIIIHLHPWNVRGSINSTLPGYTIANLGRYVHTCIVHSFFLIITSNYLWYAGWWSIISVINNKQTFKLYSFQIKIAYSFKWSVELKFSELERIPQLVVCKVLLANLKYVCKSNTQTRRNSYHYSKVSVSFLCSSFYAVLTLFYVLLLCLLCI